jgi:hypothetical protein
MFFRTRSGSVYHVLCDEKAGEAPCGARLSSYELSQLREGKPTQLMSAQKPTETPLCKHCEKHEED